MFLFFFFIFFFFFFFFKQKTAYEMSLRDWSSDVCSSDLIHQYNVGPSRSWGGHIACLEGTLHCCCNPVLLDIRIRHVRLGLPIFGQFRRTIVCEGSRPWQSAACLLQVLLYSDLALSRTKYL